MLSQKELGSLATIYFSNIQLAKSYGFKSFDSLVRMIKLMKRIGEIQEEFSKYDTEVLEFKTPDSYHRAYAFLDECREQFPKQVGMFVKEKDCDYCDYKDALKDLNADIAKKLYAFVQKWANVYVKYNDHLPLEDILEWVKNNYNVSFQYKINRYLMVTDIKDLFQEMKKSGLLEFDRF